jgi:hypothetical protein
MCRRTFILNRNARTTSSAKKAKHSNIRNPPRALAVLGGGASKGGARASSGTRRAFPNPFWARCRPAAPTRPTTHNPPALCRGGGGPGCWAVTGLSGLDAIIDNRPAKPRSPGPYQGPSPRARQSPPTPGPRLIPCRQYKILHHNRALIGSQI